MLAVLIFLASLVRTKLSARGEQGRPSRHPFVRVDGHGPAGTPCGFPSWGSIAVAAVGHATTLPLSPHVWSYLMPRLASSCHFLSYFLTHFLPPASCRNPFGLRHVSYTPRNVAMAVASSLTDVRHAQGGEVVCNSAFVIALRGPQLKCRLCNFTVCRGRSIVIITSSPSSLANLRTSGHAK